MNYYFMQELPKTISGSSSKKPIIKEGLETIDL